MSGMEMHIQFSQALPITYIPTSIHYHIIREAQPNTVLGTNATIATQPCATPGCQHTHTCDICHRTLEPPPPGSPNNIRADRLVIRSTNCAHAFHASCVYDRIDESPRFGAPHAPCGLCRWFIFHPLKELCKAQGVENQIGHFVSGVDVWVDQYKNKNMEIISDDFKVGIGLAAYFLLLKSLAQPPQSGSQYPRGVSAHADGRAIVGGLMAAIEGEDGKGKSAMLMDEQFPTRAVKAMRDAGDDRPYTDEMLDFVHEVVRLAARWYGASFGFCA